MDVNAEIIQNSARPFFSIKEGAAIAFVSVRFLYERIGKPGGPPYQKRGKKIVLPKQEFLDWAAQPIIP